MVINSLKSVSDGVITCRLDSPRMAGEIELVQSSLPNKRVYGFTVYNCNWIPYTTIFNDYKRVLKYDMQNSAVCRRLVSLPM